MTEFNKAKGSREDDPVWRDSERHLQAVFAEYPVMEIFYNSMRTMVADEREWRLTAADIKDYENDPEVALRLQMDPDYLQKYKYLWAAAIVDNTSIPVELRRELIGIIFSENEDPSPHK